MNRTALMAREDALTEALRAADAAIGKEEPTQQAMRIIDALKRLRDGRPARVPGTDRIDYLERLKREAIRAWRLQYGHEDDDDAPIGPEHDATASVSTPLGELVTTTWRRTWVGKNGVRVAWASDYLLNDEVISVREIREAGLAQRPTSRRRVSRNLQSTD